VAIVRLVMGSGVRVIAIGAAAGIAGSLVASRLLATLLYQVKPGDPLTLVSAASLLSGVALAACWSAGLRAASIDPSEALRC
jgi:ABC-type lipoprotein release transport system permease subunit